MTKKLCPKCKERKPLEAFGIKYGELGGHHNCIECRRRRVSKYRLEAMKVIANKKPVRCAKHDEWNCCADPTNLEYLSFDHIYGDGNKHREKIKGGSGLVLWIRKNPEEARERIQILCENAQRIKARRNKEYNIRQPKIISKEEIREQMNKDLQKYAL